MEHTRTYGATPTMHRGQTAAQAMFGPAMPPNVRELYEVEPTPMYDETFGIVGLEMLPIQPRTHATYMAKFDYERWLKAHGELADELFGRMDDRPARLLALSPYDDHRVRTLQNRLHRLPTATRREFGIKGGER